MGQKVYRWLDRSGNNNHLTQSNVSTQGKYEDGILRYNPNGTSFMNYARQAAATSSQALTTFSVLKVTKLAPVGNFLFGDNDKYAYHPSWASQRLIVNWNVPLDQIAIDGDPRVLNCCSLGS